MERLALAVKLAAKIREESFNDKEATKASQNKEFVDYTKFYELSLSEAAEKAASKVGYDTRGAEPVYLLLQNCWNDILAWAEQYKER